jgi:membrane associated rhomboid family serine protease
MLPLGDDNSTRRTIPVITYLLIAANFFVFFIQLAGGDAFTNDWMFVPAVYQADHFFGWITVFTSMFMHGGWLHILGNMLYLWIFGDNVEDQLGHGRFLLFYLLCGVIATFSQMAADPYSQVGSLGASGAIAGVLAAYLVLFPRQRVRVLVLNFVIPLPAILVIGIWFALQLISQLGGASDGVAYMAHIGGFLSGLVLVLILRRRRSHPPVLPY